MTALQKRLALCEQDSRCKIERKREKEADRELIVHHRRAKLNAATLMTHRSTVPTATPRHIGILFFFLSLFAVVASAQGVDPYNSIGSTTDTIRGFESRSGGSIVLLSVYAGDGKTRLDRQAVVKATDKSAHTVNWQTTDDRSQVALELQFGTYEFEVSAVGYLSEQKELQIAGALRTIPVQVILRRDPTAVDLNIADAAMPSKARKEVKSGVSALKSGNLKDARKRLDAAYKLAPSSPDLNYLLGYLAYQQKDLGQARSYLGIAANLNPHHVQALTLLGRVGLMQEDYPLAAATLEKAVEADSNYWMAHNLLAGAYLKQKKYEGARQQAALAITKGKAGASTANLTLGQALVNLGKKEEGIQALKAFVQDSPKIPTVPQVRELIAALENLDTRPVYGAETAGMNATPLPGVDLLLASPELAVSVKPWRPSGIDEVKPPVATGVSCPYERVMEMSGERVKELVHDVSRIAAIEHLLHERVDEMGNPATKETRDFNYVASVSEEEPGFIAVDEYRAEHLSRADFPDEISSSGFATLAHVFHPGMRENFEMTCEGLGNWHGQAAWLVHFKQREDQPARIHDYRVGGEIYSLRLKGRAWITADKFQIVRIESELVSPMPKIQLRSEQQVVEYGPVPFPEKNLELWLPKSAEIYLDFRKRRYFRRHSFDHYMLFSVNAEEKRKEPNTPPTEPTEKPLPN
jgi:tetratricopeptide (TPR) repeat protein